MATKSPKLLDQVRETILTKHYSYPTEQTCMDWIKRFILFYNKCHPKVMGADEVQAYIPYLAKERLLLLPRKTKHSAQLSFCTNMSSKKRSFFHQIASIPTAPNACQPCFLVRKLCRSLTKCEALQN